MFEEEINKEAEPVYILTEEQRSAIEQARLQIKSGQYRSNEQANQEIDAWLNTPDNN